MKKLCVRSLVLALGIGGALCALIMGWLAAFGWGTQVVMLLSSFYIGYEPTFLGGIIGAVWGFVDGAISGLVIGYLYNVFAAKGEKSTPVRKAVRRRKGRR